MQTAPSSPDDVDRWRPWRAVVPLGQLEDVRIVSGPPMIKDEDGVLTGYVYVEVDTARRDIGGVGQRRASPRRAACRAVNAGGDSWMSDARAGWNRSSRVEAWCSRVALGLEGPRPSRSCGRASVSTSRSCRRPPTSSSAAVSRGSARWQPAAQRVTLLMQCELERWAEEEGTASLTLCDRGVLDGLAYWPDHPDALMSAAGLTRAAALVRYDLVVHLRTPGAAQGYTESL